MTEWLTIKEVSEMLELKPATIRRHIREGELKGHKPSNKWYIAQNELDRWITGNEVEQDPGNEDRQEKEDEREKNGDEQNAYAYDNIPF